MSVVLLLACAWVLAATFVAMLPMRLQFVPGVALLIAAPVLIGVLFWVHGAWFGIAATLAFLSMFRNPLSYFWMKARGQNPQLPPEMTGGAGE